MVIGLCGSSFAICGHDAEYRTKYYLLNLYFFLSQGLPDFFRSVDVSVPAIGNLLTPSSAASVYCSSYMVDIMTTLLYKNLIWPVIFLLYVAGILLITLSFSVEIFSSISIIRWQNYKRVVSLNINKSIPVTNAQNLIPFLHSFINQLVSLQQFEKMLTAVFRHRGDVPYHRQPVRKCL